jgi:hypothetical protein
VRWVEICKAETSRLSGPKLENVSIRDKLRLIHAVIKRIDYDGASGRVTSIFKPIDPNSCSEATTKDLSES